AGDAVHDAGPARLRRTSPSPVGTDLAALSVGPYTFRVRPDGEESMPSDRQPHTLPEFASVEEERRHRKQRLAASFRLFGQFGFDEGVAGHITARDPELLDHFWVNPLGMSFKQVRVRDLLLVNERGEVVEGTWPLNGAAFAI